MIGERELTEKEAKEKKLAPKVNFSVRMKRKQNKEDVR